MSKLHNSLAETREIISELLEHAHTEGVLIEKGLVSFLAHRAHRIEELTGIFRENLDHLIHSKPLMKLERLIENIVVQIESNGMLESFWEEIALEIPDLLEWIKTIIEKGEGVVVQAAETAAEVAVESAEVIENIVTKL